MNLVATFSTAVGRCVKGILYINVILRESKLITNMELKDINHHLVKI